MNHCEHVELLRPDDFAVDAEPFEVYVRRGAAVELDDVRAV